MTELELLRLRVTELQQRGTELVEENRTLKAALAKATHSRREDVVQFFLLAGQEIGTVPRVPADEVARFRLRLIAEEFFELLEACVQPYYDDDFIQAKLSVATILGSGSTKVDLPEFIDATIDLDYVVEGARVAFGVDGDPIWDEVHRANMEKRGGPKDANGKQLKPEGWKPPDIEGKLRAQGWRPTE